MVYILGGSSLVWLQYTATHGNKLQHTATHGNTLQHTATYCNILQHTATYCNTLHTLQHTQRVMSHVWRIHHTYEWAVLHMDVYLSQCVTWEAPRSCGDQWGNFRQKHCQAWAFLPTRPLLSPLPAPYAFHLHVCHACHSRMIHECTTRLSFTRVPCVCHVCDPSIIHMYDICACAFEYVCHVFHASIINMCAMCIWSAMCVMRLSFTCVPCAFYSCVPCAMRISFTWLIHLCALTHVTHSSMCSHSRDSFIYVLSLTW